MKMDRVLLLWAAVGAGFLFSCKKEQKEIVNPPGHNYLVFGYSGAYCDPQDEDFERCEEIFWLEDGRLLEENRVKGLPVFRELPQSTYEQVKDLKGYFPPELLNEPSGEMIGGSIPMVADIPQLNVIYDYGGVHQSWRIDWEKTNVPEYLHPFVDKITEKIDIINP